MSMPRWRCVGGLQKEGVLRRSGSDGRDRPEAAVERGGGGGIGGLVDPRLGVEYDAEEAAEKVKLAAACFAGSPSLRPSMAEVVRAMEEKACKSISAVRARSNGKCDS
uniref:Uncharacterized protein n=1 Tax=Ananas comosus var. bracteatus TaxID=296719 RepID=A0A6V7P184_ANACO|nr:unnamed protein product [Ananas comosus var. bracteatus]